MQESAEAPCKVGPNTFRHTEASNVRQLTLVLHRMQTLEIYRTGRVLLIVQLHSYSHGTSASRSLAGVLRGNQQEVDLLGTRPGREAPPLDARPKIVTVSSWRVSTWMPRSLKRTSEALLRLHCPVDNHRKCQDKCLMPGLQAAAARSQTGSAKNVL